MQNTHGQTSVVDRLAELRSEIANQVYFKRYEVKTNTETHEIL